LNSEDEYGPVSRPIDKFVVIPNYVKMIWIETEEDIDKLDLLLDEEYIGIDSEWRPTLTQYHQTGPSLLQMSGKEAIFLIDLMALQICKELNDKLTQIFCNPHSIIVGFSFTSDIEQFVKKLPHMTFIRYIKNFIDAQHYFGKVHLMEGQQSLTKVAEKIFEKPMCKVEQMSNWERRPLRKTQLHYGALDAYVLVGIIKKLREKSVADGVAPFKRYVRTLDN